MSKQNNLPAAEQGGKQLDQETNFQSKDEGINKNDGGEAILTDQIASSIQETGDNEDNKENQAIGNETKNNEKTISSEEARNPGQVNKEEKSAGAVCNEGTVLILKQCKSFLNWFIIFNWGAFF